MVHARKPGVYRDMEARRAYRRAWMAAARARASTKSGEAVARKKEPDRAGVAFKTGARVRASGVSNDTPEKTIGLHGKSYPEGSPKIRIPNNWAPRNYQNERLALSRAGRKTRHSRLGTAAPARMDVYLHWAAWRLMIDKPATYWHMLPAFSQGRKRWSGLRLIRTPASVA